MDIIPYGRTRRRYHGWVRAIFQQEMVIQFTDMPGRRRNRATQHRFLENRNDDRHSSKCRCKHSQNMQINYGAQRAAYQSDASAHAWQTHGWTCHAILPVVEEISWRLLLSTHPSQTKYQISYNPGQRRKIHSMHAQSYHGYDAALCCSMAASRLSNPPRALWLDGGDRLRWSL